MAHWAAKSCLIFDSIGDDLICDGVVKYKAHCFTVDESTEQH